MNKNVSEIIAHIQEELAELTKINAQLESENENLRKRLGIPKLKTDTDLVLEDMFDNFEVKNDIRNII